jgi:hypothetical protein
MSLSAYEIRITRGKEPSRYLKNPQPSAKDQLLGKDEPIAEVRAQLTNARIDLLLCIERRYGLPEGAAQVSSEPERKCVKIQSLWPGSDKCCDYYVSEEVLKEENPDRVYKRLLREVKMEIRWRDELRAIEGTLPMKIAVDIRLTQQRRSEKAISPISTSQCAAGQRSWPP